MEAKKRQCSSRDFKNKNEGGIVERMLMITLIFGFMAVLFFIAMPRFPEIPSPTTVWHKLKNMELVSRHSDEETRYFLRERKE